MAIVFAPIIVSDGSADETETDEGSEEGDQDSGVSNPRHQRHWSHLPVIAEGAGHRKHCQETIFDLHLLPGTEEHGEVEHHQVAVAEHPGQEGGAEAGGVILSQWHLKHDHLIQQW